MLNERPLNIPTTPLIDRSQCRSTPRALTVKPPPTSKPRFRNQTEDDISVQSLSQAGDQSIDIADDPFLIPALKPHKDLGTPKSHVQDLPPEILEGIVGHVIGHLGSITSDPSGPQHSVRNWNAIMRHPRRKKVADLALVSDTWRRLVQERVYRHIKIQGTRAALEHCVDWFLQHPHLQAYVRHFEVLVPIWEMRLGQSQQRFLPNPQPDPQFSLFHAFQGLAINTNHTEDGQPTPSAFQLASKNATIDDIFTCAQALFPYLCALTIEGGHCKRPPKVHYFSEANVVNALQTPRSVATIPFGVGTSRIITPSMPTCLQENLKFNSPILHQPQPFPSPILQQTIEPQLPKLSNTKTLILKGAWNMVRSSDDFSTLAMALPSIREFHCTYHKPKTGAYRAICNSLVYHFPPTITSLNLCLEGLYTKNASSLKKWRKLYPIHHICRNLGAVTPQLESLTYTGRVCGAIFSSAIKAAEQTRGSCTRLKSIDIVVNNVCRDPTTNNDGTGMYNLAFIQGFEALVVQGVRVLQTYTSVRNMRIRFIDLDSPAPQLNPTFHLEGNRAWGLWSEEILSLLREARPDVRFLGWPGKMIDGGDEVMERDATGLRRSVGVEYYKAMAQAGGFG
ncbi:hypothetical protein IMSHALPRED_008865 [Imshaugia aleurites]|uniref:Uncharacterized protein n=1 Tax=Imshaugia aleurites TaxID=172621 RepID=A0A8H3G0H5_9LECA|nr:hypothetical protein IMSHALPRED_008865 [Imshaugia aleurites]